MAGQVTVTVGSKQWLAACAVSPWELTLGLGGLAELAAGTGMFFDLGASQIIQVTTEPMLFPLDIAFLSEDMVVTEVYRNIAPGYLVNSEQPARYFLEVNAGEMEGVESGQIADVSWLTPPVVSQATDDWVTGMVSFIGLVAIGALMVGLSRDLVGNLFEDEKGSSTLPAQCEIVSPRQYGLLSWFGTRVPDYSFAIETDAKERRIDEVLKKLKEEVDGIQQSEHFRAFLVTMSKFHDYSIGNLILIASQRPEATRVAGFNTWKDLGRWVKKGEKGIAILAPCLPPKSIKPTEPVDEKDDRYIEEGEKKREIIRPLYFKVVYVFDVSQTEGKELPEFEVPVLSGEANEELFEKVLRLAKTEGLVVGFDSKPDQAPAIKGYYSGKTIWVKPEEARAQQLKTLIHEVAHYFSEGVFRIPRRDAETIAESAAFSVGAHFGFDTGARSFPYVAIWSQDKKVLEQNLGQIRQVTGRIIEGIEALAKMPTGTA